MIKTRSKLVTVVSAILLFIASSILLTSQNTGRRAAPVIHDAVDENKLVTLAGNTRSEANADNDLGPAADSFAMNHMMMHLKRSPEQEQAAAKFVAELNDPKSPNFHKWLTAEEFGKVLPYSSEIPSNANFSVWVQGIEQASGAIAEKPSTTGAQAEQQMSSFITNDLGSSAVATLK